jgi:hypothetical protein
MARPSLERGLTRRDLMALGGLAAPIGAVVVARKFNTNEAELSSDDVGEAIGPRRLNAEPSEILAEFASVRPGPLMAYSQLFWPIYRRKQKIEELETLCVQALEANTYLDPYQVRLLPVIAHAHALGSCDPSDRAEHETYTARAHKAARGASRHEFVTADREIIEIVWRSMIGALIRNDLTWSSFLIGDEIVDEAVAVISSYMEGEEVLFTGAIFAWQFLLTYEKAARLRQVQQPNVQRAIETILSREKHPSISWFTELFRIYATISHFDTVPPQLFEVFMGYRYGNFNSEIRDFAAQVTFQKMFENYKLSGSSHTRFVPERRSREHEKVWPNVFDRYGFTKVEWKKLRFARTATLLLPEVLEYVDERLGRASVLRDAKEEAIERHRARNLGLWVPFRERDEERVYRKVFGNEPLENVLKRFDDQSEDRLREVWGETMACEGLALAKQRDLSDSKEDILARSFKEISEVAFSEQVQLLKELCDRGRSLLRTTVLAVSISATPAPAGLTVADFLADFSDSADANEGARRKGMSAVRSAEMEDTMSAEASDYPAYASPAARKIADELRQFRSRHPEAGAFADCVSAAYFKHTGKFGPLEEAWAHVQICRLCRAQYEELKRFEEKFEV